MTTIHGEGADFEFECALGFAVDLPPLFFMGFHSLNSGDSGDEDYWLLAIGYGKTKATVT